MSKTKDYTSITFNQFVKFLKTNITEFDLSDLNYKSKDEKTIKIILDSSLYNEIADLFKKENMDFSIIPSEAKIELKYNRYNGERFLKTKPYIYEIYFKSKKKELNKQEQRKQENKNTNIKDWDSFFNYIDPEYKNLLKTIIDKISISIQKNEYNQVISKKTYFLDFNNGLFERKEKLVNPETSEWRITHSPVTKDINYIFKVFFKQSEVDLNELKDYDKFLDILSNTKYQKYVKNK